MFLQELRLLRVGLGVQWVYVGAGLGEVAGYLPYIEALPGGLQVIVAPTLDRVVAAADPRYGDTDRGVPFLVQEQESRVVAHAVQQSRQYVTIFIL